MVFRQGKVYEQTLVSPMTCSVARAAYKKVWGYIKRETNSNYAEASSGLSWFFYDNMLLREVRGINLEILELGRFWL